MKSTPFRERTVQDLWALFCPLCGMCWSFGPSRSVTFQCHLGTSLNESSTLVSRMAPKRTIFLVSLFLEVWSINGAYRQGGIDNDGKRQLREGACFALCLRDMPAWCCREMCFSPESPAGIIRACGCRTSFKHSARASHQITSAASVRRSGSLTRDPVIHSCTLRLQCSRIIFACRRLLSWKSWHL